MIQPVSGISSSISALSSDSATKTSQSSFGDIWNDAIKNVQSTEAEDQQGTAALLSGDDTAIHTVMIQAQKAELALDLAVQVRNKVTDAYNEVMRMQL
jgi:flagellar hook-basal body complex protein FliE